MIRRTTIKASVPVFYMKEGEAFLCYSPAFDLVAHGDSFEDAERSFATTLKLFVQEWVWYFQRRHDAADAKLAQLESRIHELESVLLIR